MVKIRVTGTKEEVSKNIDKIKENFKVLMISDQYKNKNSEYIRVYLEVE